MEQKLLIINEIIELEEVVSTNDFMKELLSERKDCIEGLVLTANYQSNGKGRLNKSWISERGKNILLSVLLRPKWLIKDQFRISMFVSLAIIDFLRSIHIGGAMIKWPNDIYIKDKKVAGILIENVIKGGNVDYSIIGIGLNVNQSAFDEYAPNATSLQIEKQGISFAVKEVINELLFFVEKRYRELRTGSGKSLETDYLKYLYRRNVESQYYIHGRRTYATIKGVSSLGRLIVSVNGEQQDLAMGQIKFLV